MIMSLIKPSKNENPQGRTTSVEEENYKDVIKKKLGGYGLEGSRNLEIYPDENRCTFRLKSENIPLPEFEKRELLYGALAQMTELTLLEKFPSLEESYKGLRLESKSVQVEIQMVREIKDGDFDKVDLYELSMNVRFIRDDRIPGYVKQIKELLKNLKKSRISELEIRMDPNYVPPQTNNF